MKWMTWKVLTRWTAVLMKTNSITTHLNPSNSSITIIIIHLIYMTILVKEECHKQQKDLMIILITQKRPYRKLFITLRKIWNLKYRRHRLKLRCVSKKSRQMIFQLQKRKYKLMILQSWILLLNKRIKQKLKRFQFKQRHLSSIYRRLKHKWKINFRIH
jgi:hypothetical protein